MSRPYCFREAEEQCNNCKVLPLVRKQLEQESARSQDYRGKLRDIRAELSSKDRQLDVARRMLAKVNAEKTNLEVAAENDRAAFRKLEARLSLNKEGPELQAKLAKYKHRVTELKQALEDSEARLQLAEEANLVQSREVHVLKGALGLKNDSPDSTLDRQGQLLQTVAQSQEESAQLALALAAKERMVCELSHTLHDSKAEVERLLNLRAGMESRIEELKRDAQEAVALAEQQQQNAEEARAQAKSARTGEEEALAYRARTEALLRNAESGMAALQDRNRALSEKLQSMERSSRLSAEALRTEVAFAVERAEAATAQARADAAMGEAMLQERLVQCQQDLEQAKQDIVEAARARGAEASSFTAREAALREEVQRLKQAWRQHLDEADRLAGRAEQLAEANRLLKVDLGVARDTAAGASAHSVELAGALDAERRAQAELSALVAAMEERIRESLGLGSAREASLQEEVQVLRSELLACSNMVDRLQAELQLAQTQGAQAASKNAHVDTHMDELHDTIQQLTQSKARMQSSMLEQIASFRSQLEVVAEENQQLRQELTLLNQAAASRVQERSEALLQQQRKALENNKNPYASRPAPGPYDAPALHTTTTASSSRPHSASAATGRNKREGREIVCGSAINPPQESQGLLPKFRRRASSARRKDDEDSMSSEDEGDTGRSLRDAGVRKSTLLDRARAASKARGYEDTDDSDQDGVGRGGRGLRGTRGCSCPQCKSGDKGGRAGACVHARKGGSRQTPI
ncbi:hypothetical protein DUNSADRAFT_191 [Dunaliella salina]|uniref:Uncharacterized protein n=1 Tax=Dunaliella salina TaxID=3046 RepID=A0ABQ7FZB7_DUNSA|nr:hypothetical protein DUNSADRAFT_191 [Dunaliella salina]|eukprot:KAF5827703.1 hypothetical protein DUNSADRAFT_191 [Dunaliella salina]